MNDFNPLRDAVPLQEVQRVLVIDWDVHHGNGTQRSFEADPRVLVCNFHGAPPFYPGDTGFAKERGIGPGAGYTLNIPLAEGSGEEVYRAAFEEQFLPAAHTFQPEFILISAGFDAHRDDPLGCMRLSTAFFGELTRRVCALAQSLCSGRVVSMLEGGYNLNALGACAVAHLTELMKASSSTGNTLR